MECIKFSETREERRYYEDVKQKAMRYIEHTIEDWNNAVYDKRYEIRTKTFELDSKGLSPFVSKFSKKLQVIKKMVNDI